MLGVGTITQIDDKDSNVGNNKHKKLLRPMGNELVPIKQDQLALVEVKTNYKSRNKDEIKKVREN